MTSDKDRVHFRMYGHLIFRLSNGQSMLCVFDVPWEAVEARMPQRDLDCQLLATPTFVLGSFDQPILIERHLNTDDPIC